MKKLLPSLLFIFCSFLSHAQWVERNNGLEGGTVSCFATLGTTLFAGTVGGVFKSTDNGATWNASSNGMTWPNVYSLAAVGSDVFAGTQFGVFRSSDNGVSWTKPNKEFATGVRSMIAIGDYLFVKAVKDGDFGLYGLYRSADRGVNWTKIDALGFIDCFVEMGADLYASATLANEQNGGIYRTSNKGDSWVKSASVGLPTSNRNINSIVSKEGNLYVVVDEYENDNTNLYKSTNKGENWTFVSTVLQDGYFMELAVKGENLFLTSDKGVYRSADNGVSWVSINAGLSNVKAYTFGIAGNNLLAGTNRGVFTTTNSGASWASSNSGLSAATSGYIIKKGSDFFTFTISQRANDDDREKRGFFMSSNKGVTWSERITTGLIIDDVTSMIAVGNDLFAGTGRGGVFYSTDNGLNWTARNNGLETDNEVRNLLSDGDKIFVHSQTGIFSSTNKGQSWTRLSSAEIYFVQLVNGTLFISGTEVGEVGGVYRSVDGGANWTKIESDINYLYDVKAVGSNLYAFGDRGFYMSTNAGVTWTLVEEDLPKLVDQGAGYSLAVNGNSLFAGTFGGGVFVSTDFGKKWKAINEGVPPNLITSSLSVIENSLWASFYGRGLWERPLVELAPPATPVATAASSINSTGFTANWAAASGATSYQLDISKDNFVTFVDGYNAKTVTGTSHAVSGLTSNTTYQYRVRAVNELGISGNSASVSATTLIPLPTAPTALAATAISATGFTANWAAVSSATGYQLDISKDNFATFVEGYNPKTVATTSQSVTGLPPVTAYQYRVRAVNDGGVSGNSASVSVTTNVVITGDLNSAATTKAVYPNPFADYIEIENKTGEITEIVLYDVTGRRSVLPFEDRGEVLRVPTNTTPAGVYLLSIQEGTSVKTAKMMKR
jgi:photosystem II stability/assembly factor-like uncharacterized protein